MNCNIFVCVVVLSFVAVCVEGGLHCLHTVSVDVGSAAYCVYAQLENGKEYQFCNADSHITYNLPPFPDSTMNKCEKFPGYLKFYKCNTNNCNTGCETTAHTTTTKSEVTTEQASTTTVESTTAFPTTKEETTTQTLTTTSASTKTAETHTTAQLNQSSTVSNNNVTKASTANITFGSTTIQTPIWKETPPATSATFSKTLATCSVDSTSDSLKPNVNNDQNGGVQGTRNVGNLGKGLMRNNPPYRPNNCDCRCDHKKEQNTFIVVNSATPYNTVITILLTIVAYLF